MKNYFYTGNKLLIIYLIISFANLNIYAQKTEENSSEYPFLADIMDIYFSYNYSMPKNITELVSFTEELFKTYPNDIYFYEILKKNTFVNLIKKKKSIYIFKTRCGFTMYENKKMIYENLDSPCCDKIDDYYFEDQSIVIQKKINTALFFKKKAIIDNNELLMEFIKERDKIYSKFNTDKNNLVILDYKKKILPYCNEEKICLDNEYIEEMNCFLREFTKKNKLKRIIFYSYNIY